MPPQAILVLGLGIVAGFATGVAFMFWALVAGHIRVHEIEGTEGTQVGEVEEEKR